MDVATLVTEGIFTRRGSNPYLWTRIDWYINVDGRGTFELSADRVPLTDFRHPDPILVDIDNDGDDDLYFAYRDARNGTQKFNWLENVDGWFAEAQQLNKNLLSLPHYATQPVPVELDGTGSVEYLALTQGGILSVYSDRDGVFERSVDLQVDIANVYPTPIIADLDSDGDNDVIFNSLVDVPYSFWFRNDGELRFERQSLITGETVQQVGDFDNDGDVDMLATFESGAAYYENDGEAKFNRHDITPADGVRYDAFAHSPVDWDSDGDLDFVIQGNWGGAIVKLNEGDRFDDAFYPFLGLQVATRDVHFADFDSDGLADVLLSDGREISWVRNEGGLDKLTAPEPIPIAPRVGPQSYPYFQMAPVGFDDIDGDGDKDIVQRLPHGNSTNLFWFENFGGGNYSTYKAVVDFNVDHLIDVDGDGFTDLITFPSRPLENVDLAMTWHRNLGGTFEPNEVLQSAIDLQGRSLMPIDPDDDGDIDFYFQGFINGDNTTLLLRNNGLGEFSVESDYSLPRIESIVPLHIRMNLTQHVLHDLNSDGYLDVIGTKLVGETIVTRWFLGSAEGFNEPMQQDIGHQLYFDGSFGVTDLDSDGRWEIVAGSREIGLHYREFNADTTSLLSPEIIDADAKSWTSIFLPHDFDGDGRIDLGVGQGRDELRWYRIQVTGDVTMDGLVDGTDIDAISYAIRSESSEPRFDLNGDAVVDDLDRNYLIDTILKTHPGDADLNGVVDFADFVALSQRFGRPGTWSDGDFDGDGSVNFGDFLLLSINFGRDRAGQIEIEPMQAVQK